MKFAGGVKRLQVALLLQAQYTETLMSTQPRSPWLRSEQSSMHQHIRRVLVAMVLMAVWSVSGLSWAENPPQSDQLKAAERADQPPADHFELKDGDRVVFIGNTFFEREGCYGYIETMLTTRYPGKRITFRNLGWSGDTVWGESRGYFEPEKGYQNLVELVRELKPTVIFLAYGNNEAFAGKEGLKPFVKQYNKLLDDLERFTKRIVLFGTIRHVPKEAVRARSERVNAVLEVYDTAIRMLASRRAYVFIDASGFWSSDLLPFSSGPEDSDNGIHGTKAGYHAAAYQIRNLALNADLPRERVTVGNVRIDEGGNVSAEDTRVTEVKLGKYRTVLKILDPLLPLPPDVMEREGARERGPTSHRYLEVQNLPDGKYRCLIDGNEVATITLIKRPGVEGIPIIPEERQVEQLQAAIIAKNELFFHRWRPQNTTYLLGFRKHEQGQNAKEIAQFDPLIAAKEEEIFKLAQPVSHKYELIQVKDDLPDGKTKSDAKTDASKEGGK